jgi:CheY-like chemotaxis protein
VQQLLVTVQFNRIVDGKKIRRTVIVHQGSILVVEDDHDTRVSLRFLLEDEGYTVLTATDGSSALELLRNAHPKPCVILLDLMLPVMNGWSFAERLKARPEWKGIPIVIMSAFQEPAPPAGVVGFCKKPLDLGSLLKLVEQYC